MHKLTMWLQEIFSWVADSLINDWRTLIVDVGGASGTDILIIDQDDFIPIINKALHVQCDALVSE